MVGPRSLTAIKLIFGKAFFLLLTSDQTLVNIQYTLYLLC